MPSTVKPFALVAPVILSPGPSAGKRGGVSKRDLILAWWSPILAQLQFLAWRPPDGGASGAYLG